MNICFSGAAKGADLAWGIAASEMGHDVCHFSFSGHSSATKDNLYVLSAFELQQADETLKKVSK
jgi:hypothetical protein